MDDALNLIMIAHIRGVTFETCLIFASSAPSVLVHLWRYRGGYPALTEVMNKLRQNKVMGARTISTHWQFVTL